MGSSQYFVPSTPEGPNTLSFRLKLALLDREKDRHRGDGLFVTLAMRKIYEVLTRPSFGKVFVAIQKPAYQT